jgi:hypothetical protein
MAVEVTCGHCQGDILIESLAATITCPLCGSVLELPDLEAAIDQPTDPPPQTPPAANDDATVIDVPALGGAPLAQGADSRSADPTEILPVMEPFPAVMTAPAPAVVTTAAAVAVDAPPRSPRMATGPALEASPQQAGLFPETVPWNWFVLAISYASAVTMVLLYLWLTAGSRRQHALESLPDLVPEVHNGQVAMKVPPPQIDVAPGHVLRLGESQRFGSVKVTPVKITRGPLRFVHALGDKGARREPTQAVLKLWLRFDNVSRDQRFTPLDRTLVFKRIFRERVFTNNFLCAVDQRREDGQLFYVYDMPEFSEFLIVGQDLGQRIGPGETWETFIPSEEGITDVRGEWVWRVQFRKGYHPRSGRGVTTLVDVRFHPDDILDDA